MNKDNIVRIRTKGRMKMFDPKKMIVANVRDLSLSIKRYMQNENGMPKDPFGEGNEHFDRTSRLQGMAIGFMYSHQGHQFIQKDIEKGMHVSKSTASGLVQRMVKNGLVYTTPSANDARVKCLNLTNHAIDIMQEIDKQATKTEKDLSRGIDPKDLETFFKVIRQIKENTK